MRDGVTIVTPSLIGWVHTKNDHCNHLLHMDILHVVGYLQHYTVTGAQTNQRLYFEKSPRSSHVRVKYGASFVRI